jgi:hypothetical protein
MRVTRVKRALHHLMIALAVALPRFAAADEIEVLCSNGIRAVMQELVPRFEQTTNHRIRVTYGVAVDLNRRVEAGESFDVAVLTPALIDDAADRGAIARDTTIVVARSPMAIAIRAGTRTADIGTRSAAIQDQAGRQRRRGERSGPPRRRRARCPADQRDPSGPRSGGPGNVAGGGARLPHDGRWCEFAERAQIGCHRAHSISHRADCAIGSRADGDGAARVNRSGFQAAAIEVTPKPEHGAFSPITGTTVGNVRRGLATRHRAASVKLTSAAGGTLGEEAGNEPKTETASRRGDGIVPVPDYCRMGAAAGR